MHAIVSSATLFGPANPSHRISAPFAFILSYLAGRDDNEPLQLLQRYLERHYTPSKYREVVAAMCNAGSLDGATELLRTTLGLGALDDGQRRRLAAMARQAVAAQVAHLRATIAAQEAQAQHISRLLHP